MAIVMGVGSGVFGLLILAVVFMAACYLSQGTRHATNVGVGTTCMFLLVLIFMLASPRGTATRTAVEAEISGYDDTVTNRALMLASMVLGAVTAGGSVAAFHLYPPVYAKPLDYAADIIGHEMQSKGKRFS